MFLTFWDNANEDDSINKTRKGIRRWLERKSIGEEEEDDEVH